MTDFEKDVKISDAKYFPCPPDYWKRLNNPLVIFGKYADDYSRCYNFNGINVIVSVGIYSGREWLHVSFSRKSRLPDYKDLQLVKRDFIGKDKKAVMVFPEEENYVSIAENCLHLWYSEENPLPEFSGVIKGLGKSI